MLDWNTYRIELLSRIGDIAAISPDTLRGYQTLSGAARKNGRLDAKTVELIALAVAVALNAGAAMVYSAHALNAVAAVETKAP